MTFTPVVRTSHSIPKSLMEFSKERKIDVRLLDFELISYETLIRREHDDEYSVVEDAKEITQDDLKNQYTSIIQEYSIKIMPRQKVKLNESIKISLAANKLKTKAVVTIAKGSVFKNKVNLLKELRDTIWEKKLRAGLYIDIFEPKLNAQLKKLLQVVPYDKPLPKELKFTVAAGLEPIVPVDAKLEKLYEQKEPKSIIDGVEKGELIARYIKEKNGSDGRGCNGKYIQVRKPKVINTRPEVDPTVMEKEHKEFVEYFAQEDGYVVLKDKKLMISKELTLSGADFKSTANIDSGEGDKDISVHIKHKKTYAEDAIGSGVNIDVKKLDVDGSVGSNVNISTDELKVDAQTHKNSKMEVTNQANIKLHRGDLRANDAEIDILETGKITARNSIHIKKMLGGEAIAPIVKVDELLSNSTIIASDLIEIKSLSGENNTLIINPDAIESYHAEVQKLQGEIKSFNKELEEKQKDFQERFTQHAAQAKRIKTFQARVLQATKAGKTPMKQDILRVKLYKKDSEAFALEKQSLTKEIHKLEDLKSQLEKIYNKELHAKIKVHTRYDGHTKVVFVDLKTKEEIDYRPEGKIDTISLTLNEKEEKVIKLD